MTMYMVKDSIHSKRHLFISKKAVVHWYLYDVAQLHETLGGKPYAIVMNLLTKKHTIIKG